MHSINANTRRSMGLSAGGFPGQNNIRLKKKTRKIENLHYRNLYTKSPNVLTTTTNKSTKIHSVHWAAKDVRDDAKIARPSCLLRYRNRINMHKIRTEKLSRCLDRVGLKHSIPIVSNMPMININSSIILMTHSPFALSDRRFGILHHSSPSASYI